MTNSSGVIVWEWKNKTNRWQQYDPLVSNFLESKHEDEHSPKASLSEIDPAFLSAVMVDFIQMSQTNTNTGETQTLRRSPYSSSSCAAQGIEWQWFGDDHQYHSYDFMTMDIIEKNKHNGETHLQLTRCRMPYTIDFLNMEQRKNGSDFKRTIRRMIMLDGSSFRSSSSSLGASGGGGVGQSVAPVTLSPVLPSHSGPINGSVSNPQAMQSDSRTQDTLYNFCQYMFNPPSKTDCVICLSDLSEDTDYAHGNCTVLKLRICQHMFHEACLQQLHNNTKKGDSIQCPTCKMIYGTTLGNCPYGTMHFKSSPTTLSGHPGHGSLQLIYDIKSGMQGPEHPNPGVPFTAHAFPRMCHLPDTEEGRLALRLLVVAWQRRLTFTVGMSLTSGRSNSVVWNEIHHKTDATSNRSSHGFPDPNYLTNLFMELQLQGITKADAESVQL